MSSTSSSVPNAGPKAAAMATRALVSESSPANTKSASQNYEDAAAAATKAGQLPATTASSAAASVNDRPGMQRQQSWKRSDLKGQQQAQMVANKAGGQGYSTTQK